MLSQEKYEKVQRCINLSEKRLGETKTNNYGEIMFIIEYNNANDIVVQFENNIMVNTTYNNFKKGCVRHNYSKTLCGVGYLGDGIYNFYCNENPTSEYLRWKSMIMRCYSLKEQEKRPTYKDVTVCDEWLNFQNFAKWFNENYYEIENENMALDKDILIKGNKIYSPNTCCFVPEKINNLFVKNNKCRGDLPIGVYHYKYTNKYMAKSNNGKGQIDNLGIFDTIEKAFIAYKTYKEELIKKIANNYKDEIPKKLYNVMMNYKVEITD